jgi:hypothetical protein
MQKIVDEAYRSGEMLATDGLQPISKGARVKRSNGTTTVIDGPFVEAKELVGGYAIFELKSKEAAVSSAEQFLQVAGDGEVEIRQIYERSDFV